jgi:hypothetical protein
MTTLDTVRTAVRESRAKTVLVAAIVSAIWAVICVNAFSLGIHIGEQECVQRGE